MHTCIARTLHPLLVIRCESSQGKHEIRVMGMGYHSSMNVG